MFMRLVALDATGNSRVKVAPWPRPALATESEPPIACAAICAAMQSESVAFFARGEAVRENAGEIFRRNPNAIIRDNDVNGALVCRRRRRV